jgi:putative ABC transport system permease protein
MQAQIPPIALRIVPGLRHLRVDSTVVLFTLGLCFVACVASSLPAIFQLAIGRTRIDLADALRGRGASADATLGHHRMRSGLVVFELAAALILLVGAGLMADTFRQMADRYQGFDPKNVLTMKISLPATEYRDPSQIVQFEGRAIERLGAIHGVEAASIVSASGSATGFVVEGRPAAHADAPRPELMSVSSRYLDTMKIPLFGGRFLSAADGQHSPHVIVVSDSVKQYYWPREDAIGRRVQLNGKADWFTVVGVTGDVIGDWFTGKRSYTAYVPYTQMPTAGASFDMRTNGDPRLTAASARREIAQMDKQLPVYDLKTMEQAMYEERGGVRSAATTMNECATIALLLAITGIYAIISHSVTARRHEIGVRMAIGATRLDIMKLTMRETLVLLTLGLAFGLPLAILLAKAMSAALYGVVAVSWTTFLTFGSVLSASALLASYVPSRRASCIDPMVALRDD